LLLLLAAFLVVPYEEIVFRGFIFNRVRATFNKSFLISGVITSILFALYHWQEGIGAVIAIFIFALFITWLYKVFKGNLWYLIFFHLAYDVFMLTMIRLGKM
jgi:membrane protease YdiL (CAAX protease family)